MTFKRLLALAAFFPIAAHAQQAKEIKVPKDKPAAVLNLVSTRNDCTQGAVGIPVIRQQPAHGSMSMVATNIDAAAQGNCPARKAVAITLLYSPTNGFTGSDSVTIDVVMNNQTTSFTYKLSVGPAGETL